MVRGKIWVLHCLLLMEIFLVSAAVEEKAESAMPTMTSSPPEGNTSFIGGTTWCVARPGMRQDDLQSALDWACGLGKTDCSPIQRGGACYEPNTLLSHAAYAFNKYYQQNGNSDIACNFGGTAAVTKTDPSYEKCHYDSAQSTTSSAPPAAKYKPIFIWWKSIVAVVMVLVLRR